DRSVDQHQRRRLFDDGVFLPDMLPQRAIADREGPDDRDDAAGMHESARPSLAPLDLLRGEGLGLVFLPAGLGSDFGHAVKSNIGTAMPRPPQEPSDSRSNAAPEPRRAVGRDWRGPAT